MRPSEDMGNMTAEFTFEDMSRPLYMEVAWGCLQREGMGDVVLCKRGATLDDWFANLEDKDGAGLYGIIHDGTARGLIWVQDGINGIPFIHFAFFRHDKHMWKEMGFAALNFTATLYGSDAVLALWPVKYRHLNAPVQAWGFEPMGILPGGCILHGRKCDAKMAIWRK